MDEKEQWLKRMGLPGGRPSGGSTSGGGGGGPMPPAPKLDASGAQSNALVLSWDWPGAPAGATFAFCYRGASGAGTWRTDRIAGVSASGHVLRSLSPKIITGPRGAPLRSCDGTEVRGPPAARSRTSSRA